MKTTIYRENGSSDVLRIVERDRPEPAAGEVRVRVVRAGVNPEDWKDRVCVPLAFDEITPGQDGSGVVDAVGVGVDSVAVGDRVWLTLAQQGRPGGSAAEYTVQPADHVFPLPPAADFDLGASLGLPAITAHRALTSAQDGPDRLGPGTLAGRTVLVAGGAGAVGNAAIQLARWSGATVITTVSSTEKGFNARAAQPDHVVNHVRADDPAATIRKIAPDGVDLVVEVSPADNNELDLAVIKNHGTIAVYADEGGARFSVDVAQAFRLNVRYQFLHLDSLEAALIRTAAEDVTRAVAAGALGVGWRSGLPLHHFDLDSIADAHDTVEGRTIGKVLLDVSQV